MPPDPLDPYNHYEQHVVDFRNRSADPLDRMSGVGDALGRDLSWRELKAAFEHEMRVWDMIGARARFDNQKANDPHYRPIAPGAGLRMRRRR